MRWSWRASSSPTASTAGGLSDGTIQIWDTTTGAKVRSLRGPQGSAGALAVSADGKRILSAHEGGALALWDTESGAEVGAWHSHFGPVISLVMGPEGRTVLSSGHDGRLHLWDTAGGR